MTEPGKPLHHHLRDYFFPHHTNDYRPHLFSRASVIVLATLVIMFEVGYIAQTKFLFLDTDFLAAVLPGVLADLTNVARADSGVSPVTRNAVLDAAAQAAAEDMATKGYFAHVAPDGTTPWYWLEKAGYKFSYAGQNLAVNFTDSENVETAWLASPTHRENIMKPQYTEIGFGTANGMYEGQETTFVVEYFAAPAVAAAQPKATTPVKTVAVAAKPAPMQTVSPSVLGTEAKQTVPPVTTAAPAVADTQQPAAAQIPPQAKSFVSMLASPLTTLEAILTALLVVIAAAYGIAVLVKGKMQHPSVVFGGAFLLLLISATLIGSALLTGPVEIASSNQMASVEAAF